MRHPVMTRQPVHLGPGTEQPQTQTPAISLLLAYAAMLPVVAGTALSLRLPGKAGVAASRLTIGWCGGLLCFLSGVRRGLSFREPGGPTLLQLGSMLWLFVTGIGGLLSPGRKSAMLLLLLGFGSEAVLDPAAALRRQAPRYFFRLRPAQLSIPIVSLVLLLRREARKGLEDRS